MAHAHTEHVHVCHVKCTIAEDFRVCAVLSRTAATFMEMENAMSLKSWMKSLPQLSRIGQRTQNKRTNSGIRSKMSQILTGNNKKSAADLKSKQAEFKIPTGYTG